MIRKCSIGIIYGLIILFGFGLVAMSQGAERAISEGDIYNACCRVYAGNVAGSGCAFYQDETGAIYILTNYHVAGTSDCSVHFFYDGDNHILKAKNIWRAYNENKSLDAVILKVEGEQTKHIKHYVPLWTGAEKIVAEEDMQMFTVGGPKALWLRAIRGRIRMGNGNCVFKPTPFGGQSGSSIFIKRGGRWFVGALLTWRSMDEGTEDYGGLAQPIERVTNAMAGNVAEMPDVPLPANATICPWESVPSGGKVIECNGVKMIECAGYANTVEIWTMEGCQPCQLVKANYAPTWRKYADVKIRDGMGNDRVNALALGITQFPTIRVVDAGQKEIYRGVGYSYTVHQEVLKIIQKEKEIKTVQTNSGRFGLFDKLPKPDDDETPLPDNKEEDIDTPKTAPRNDGSAGGILGGGRLLEGLESQISAAIEATIAPYIAAVMDAIDARINQIKMALFWMCFAGCTAALLCYKFVVGILKAVFACFKWAFKKLVESIKGLGQKSLEAIANAVNEKKTSKKNE